MTATPALVEAHSLRIQAPQHLKEGAVTADPSAVRPAALNLLNEIMATEIDRTSRSHADYGGGALRERIMADLVADRGAIDSYRDLLRYVGDKDPTTSQMVAELLDMAEKHVDELTAVLESLPAQRPPRKSSVSV